MRLYQMIVFRSPNEPEGEFETLSQIEYISCDNGGVYVNLAHEEEEPCYMFLYPEEWQPFPLAMSPEQHYLLDFA